MDCYASESYFGRNELFGTSMGLMSENDMMSMVQGMVDYTKQPQFNNQNVNNNGGFPFTNSGLPKQSDNAQSLINQNNGLVSFGNVNGQQSGVVANQGRSNNDGRIPQRGSEILSQPIFPSENDRFTKPSSGQAQGTSNSFGPESDRSNENGNSNNIGGASNNANFNQQQQQPTVFVSSLGELSTDPNLRFNPFTTAIVSTKTFDTLPSNVDPVSTSAYQVQKLALHGQFNQLNGNSQSKSPSGGSENHSSLQHEINQLSVSASNEGSNTVNDPPVTAVFSGSGDSLSQTIGQYGKSEQSQGRDPSLSALVNSLGETILTPIFSGEGNLLSQTIGRKGAANNGNNFVSEAKTETTASAVRQGMLV